MVAFVHPAATGGVLLELPNVRERHLDLDGRETRRRFE